MTQKYEKDCKPRIRINQNEYIEFDVDLRAIENYLEYLIAKGVIEDFDELESKIDDLTDVILQDDSNDWSAAIVKQQINLVRETKHLFKGMLTRIESLKDKP